MPKEYETMIPHIPWYLSAVVVATDLTLAAIVWRLIASATERGDASPGARRAIRIGSAVFIAAWLGAAMLLAPAPASLFSRDRFYLSPLIPLFVVIPATIAALALWRSPALRRTVSAIPVSALVGVQVFRVVGAVFVILLAQGQLPAHFALPAGWGDVAIGLTAPVVAFALARGGRGSRSLGIGWNVLGLLDLVVAVGMGTGFLAPLLAPSLGHVPPAAAMGVYPLIVIPTFAVPIAVLLHVAALTRSVREVRFSSGLAAATVA